MKAQISSEKGLAVNASPKSPFWETPFYGNGGMVYFSRRTSRSDTDHT
jgi:hypothetical protein